MLLERHPAGLFPLLAAIALGAMACSDSNGGDADAGTLPSDGGTDTDGGLPTDGGTDPLPAKVRVIHASPDTPAVDLYVKGTSTPLITDLSYGESTNYLEVDAGQYIFEVRPAGASADTTPIFETGAVAAPPGAGVTAIAAGLLGSSDAADELRLIGLVDDFASPAAGRARVRVVHASPDAPNFGLDLGDDATSASEVEVPSLARFASTGADGFDLPASTSLQVALWSTGAGAQRLTAFTVPALPTGTRAYAIATGLVAQPAGADEAFSILAVTEHGAVGFIKQNPVIYALHGATDDAGDALAVDIFVGPMEVLDNFRFGTLAGPLQVPPADYPLDFFAHVSGDTRPAGDPAATASSGELQAGQTYLLTAAGKVGVTGDGEFTLINVPDQISFTEGRANVTFIHAAADLPTVTVGVAEGGEVTTPLYSNLDFRGVDSGPGDLDPGDYTLGVSFPPSTDAVLTYDVTLPADLRAFAAAIPIAGDDGAQLAVVDASEEPWTLTVVTPNTPPPPP